MAAVQLAQDGKPLGRSLTLGLFLIITLAIWLSSNPCRAQYPLFDDPTIPLPITADQTARAIGIYPIVKWTDEIKVHVVSFDDQRPAFKECLTEAYKKSLGVLSARSQLKFRFVESLDEANLIIASEVSADKFPVYLAGRLANLPETNLVFYSSESRFSEDQTMQYFFIKSGTDLPLKNSSSWR